MAGSESREKIFGSKIRHWYLLHVLQHLFHTCHRPLCQAGPEKGEKVAWNLVCRRSWVGLPNLGTAGKMVETRVTKTEGLLGKLWEFTVTYSDFFVGFDYVFFFKFWLLDLFRQYVYPDIWKYPAS